MTEITEAEWEAAMPYIMRQLKQHRWTYSDTPGMGNVPPYTVKEVYRARPVILPKDPLSELPDVPLDLERYMLDHDLHKARQFTENRKGGMLPIAEYRTDEGRKLDRRAADMREQALRNARRAQPSPWWETIKRGVRGIAKPIEQPVGQYYYDQPGMLVPSPIDGTMYPNRRPGGKTHGGGGVRG